MARGELFFRVVQGGPPGRPAGEQALLRIIREGQRWLTALFVVGIGLVFVFFLGLGNAPGGRTRAGTVARVGPMEIDGPSFERARARNESFLQQQLGEQYDSRRFGDTLDGMAVRDLVNEALLVLSAEDLGIRVSKAEIEQVVLQEGGFRDEGGRFDPAAFRDFAQYQFGSEANFMEAQRNQLLSLKVMRLLSQQPHISDGQVRSVLERELERVKLAFVALDVRVDEDATIDPARIQEAIASRAAELETLYDSQRSRFESPEEVHARHILVRVAQDAPEAELASAQARADEIMARLAGGEDFDAVARETTDDDASRGSGGDLGFFRSGQMVTEFEEAAFAAEVGTLAGPVRSSFGLHIIRVEEHREAVDQSLDDVREELAEELVRQDVALEAARAQADALAAAIRAGESLESAARAQDAALDRTDWVSRRQDGFIPGLGAAPELLATVFSIEPGSSSPRIFEVGSQLVLVQVLEREDADPDLLAERFDETREQLLNERRNELAETWVGAKRDALLDRDELHVNIEGYRQR